MFKNIFLYIIDNCNDKCLEDLKKYLSIRSVLLYVPFMLSNNSLPIFNKTFNNYEILKTFKDPFELLDVIKTYFNDGYFHFRNQEQMEYILEKLTYVKTNKDEFNEFLKSIKDNYIKEKLEKSLQYYNDYELKTIMSILSKEDILEEMGYNDYKEVKSEIKTNKKDKKSKKENDKNKQKTLTNIINENKNEIITEDYNNKINCKMIQTNYKNINNLYVLDFPFYQENYSILNIQRLNNYNYLIHLKNIKNNKTEYVIVNKNNEICYVPTYNTKSALININDVTPIYVEQINKFDKENSYYDYDIDFSIKIFIDQKLTLKEKAIKSSFDYCIIDIEVYTGDYKGFPKPEEALFEVPVVTLYSSKDDIYYYFTYEKSVNIDEINFANQNFKTKKVLCKNENDLLLKIVEKIKEHDIVSGWNLIFDLGYIYTRLNYLGYNAEDLFSKIENYKATLSFDPIYINFPGIITVDLLTTYRKITMSEKESFALNYIAELELGLNKTSTGLKFNEMWDNDKHKAIDYNIHDVILCKLLNDKLDLIGFLNELRFIFNVPWDLIHTTTKALDGLLSYYAKQKGMLLNRRFELTNPGIIGGFVHEPLKGIFDVVQYDFSSLYPSIILTTNLGTDTLFGKFSRIESLRDFVLYLNGKYDEDKKIKFQFFNTDSREYEPKEIKFSELKKLFEEYKCIITMNNVVYRSDKESFLGEVLNDLLSKRKKEKQLYKETNDKVHDLKQWAYKIAANSLYGYLGTTASRFFMADMAESITKTGQILNKIVSLFTERFYFDSSFNEDDLIELFNELVNNYFDPNTNLPNRTKIVYGDTDSIFIKVNEDIKKNIEKFDKEKIGENFVNKVAEYFAKYIMRSDRNKFKMELKYLAKMLTIAKKRYVYYATYPEEEFGSTGVELKRSDYPKFFKEKFSDILFKLLKDNIPLKEITEIIYEVENEALERLNNLDPDLGKPSSWSNDEYKTIPYGVKGMLLFNALFWDAFSFGSKGLLYQIKLYPNSIPKEKIKNYLNSLSKINGLNNKLDLKRELDNAKWICIPRDLSDSERNEILSKINDYFILDTEYINTMWINKVEDLGLLVQTVQL